MLDSTLPAAPALVTPAKDEVLFVANADLRESATLDGAGRDQLMAGDVLRAFVAQALTQGLRVKVAGDAATLL